MNNYKKSKHKLRKGILRTDTLLLNREDVTLLLISNQIKSNQIALLLITAQYSWILKHVIKYINIKYIKTHYLNYTD